MTWVNHYYHCDVDWDDEWDCQCNDECPACGGEIEPYASTDVESDEIQIHNQQVYDNALDEVPCCLVCGDSVCTEHKGAA